MTDAFRRARKNYILFAALFIAWELIGFELEDRASSMVNVTIKSPEAAPWVLVILVIYFSYRLSIEWMQLEQRIKDTLPIRIEMAVSHCIAIFPIGLWSFQKVSNSQISHMLWLNPFLPHSIYKDMNDVLIVAGTSVVFLAVMSIVAAAFLVKGSQKYKAIQMNIQVLASLILFMLVILSGITMSGGGRR